MIEYIQTTFSAPVIGWIGPLVIVLLMYSLFGRRLPDRVKVPAAVYVFSIVTGIIFDITQEVSNVDSATVAGIYVPVPYYVFFGLLSVIRHRYYASAKRPHPVVVKLDQLATGSAGLLVCIVLGGIIGLIVGGIATFAGLTYAAYDTLPDLLVDETALESTFSDDVVSFAFNAGVYAFGALGALYGAILCLRGGRQAESDDEENGEG